MTVAVDIVITREELIKQLKARLPEFKAHDAACLKEHREKEKAALALFRERCREALKWDWKTVSTNEYTAGLRYGGWHGGKRSPNEIPYCPARVTDGLEDAIKALELSQAKTMTLHPGGVHDYIHRMLTLDLNPKPKDC